MSWPRVEGSHSYPGCIPLPMLEAVYELRQWQEGPFLPQGWQNLGMVLTPPFWQSLQDGMTLSIINGDPDPEIEGQSESPGSMENDGVWMKVHSPAVKKERGFNTNMAGCYVCNNPKHFSHDCVDQGNIKGSSSYMSGNTGWETLPSCWFPMLTQEL